MNRREKKLDEYDLHHINPYGSGTESPDNLIELNRGEHEAYHKLFQNMGIIDALRKLFTRGDSAIADGKVKEELKRALEALDYKDSCKGGSKKKRR